MGIEELITKQEIQSKTITKLIIHKDTSKEDKEKFEACNRFIKDFITDLKNLKNK